MMWCVYCDVPVDWKERSTIAKHLMSGAHTQTQSYEEKRPKVRRADFPASIHLATRSLRTRQSHAHPAVLQLTIEPAFEFSDQGFMKMNFRVLHMINEDLQNGVMNSLIRSRVPIMIQKPRPWKGGSTPYYKVLQGGAAHGHGDGVVDRHDWTCCGALCPWQGVVGPPPPPCPTNFRNVLGPNE